jgi:glucose-1-phosphate thymidylyltransferase
VIEPCYIHPTAKLERCAIGPYVTIGAHAVIEDSVISDSIVGEGAVLSGQCIRRSIIGSFAELHTPPVSFNVADHSVIGPVGLPGRRS